MRVSTKYFLCFLLVFVLTARSGQAQREYFNWYFEPGLGIGFNSGRPVPLAGNPVPFPTPNGRMSRVSTISDSLGRVLFVTDGRQVWDRMGQLMPGGRDITAGIATVNGNHDGGDLALKMPGSSHRYLILQEGGNGLITAGGTDCPDFYYTMVNMRARGGLGDVEGPAQQVLLPPSGSALNCFRSNTEAIRHANGRDLWLVFRNGDDRYFSYLLTAAGISLQPVQSRALPKAANIFGMTILKASPDSRRLVFAESFDATFDVEAFDAATGQVQPQYRMRGLRNCWGLAFSPDGSKLYADSLNYTGSINNVLLQYDLTAGSPQAVAASRQNVLTSRCTGGFTATKLQLGPDGCLYILLHNADYIGRLRLPNAPGLASRFEPYAVPIPNKRPFFLVRLPNDLNLPPVRIQAGGVGGIGTGVVDSLNCNPTGGSTPTDPSTAAGNCQDQLLYFQAGTSPFLSAAAYAWDFGDPGSGASNFGSGQAPTHRFSRPGTFTVRLRMLAADGREITAQQVVEVKDCANLPNIITPNGDGQNETFTLRGLRAPDWTLRLYNRWGREIYQKEQYDNSWAAQGQADGVYYYLLTNAQTGQKHKGWLEVVR